MTIRDCRAIALAFPLALGRAARLLLAEVGPQEAVIVVALALVAWGVAEWQSPAVAAIVVGLVLLALAWPRRQLPPEQRRK